jgi:hypothetical protein
VHYAFVTWIQFALLAVPLPGAAKGVLVFALALVLAWNASMLSKHIPFVARVL